MRFLVHTDGANKVPKDCSEEDARALQAQGFHVERLNDEGEAVPFEPEQTEEVAEEAVVKPAAKKPAAKKAKA
jgi:hypothetical protein